VLLWPLSLFIVLVVLVVGLLWFIVMVRTLKVLTTSDAANAILAFIEKHMFY
jgi:hypothetical protein